MKVDEILDAIGMVDEECVKRTKEKEKPRRRGWIVSGAVVACLLIAVLVPTMQSFFRHGGTGPTENSLNEVTVEWKNIWIYYVDGVDIERIEEYLPCDPQEIFSIWKQKNGIGEEVQLLRVMIDSNGTTTEKDSVVEHQVGDYFILNLTVSSNLETYYEQVNPDKLLESLKRTMTDYSFIECNEYHLALE